MTIAEALTAIGQHHVQQDFLEEASETLEAWQTIVITLEENIGEENDSRITKIASLVERGECEIERLQELAHEDANEAWQWESEDMKDILRTLQKTLETIETKAVQRWKRQWKRNERMLAALQYGQMALRT